VRLPTEQYFRGCLLVASVPTITVVLTPMVVARTGGNKRALRDWLWREGLDFYETYETYKQQDGSLLIHGQLRDLFTGDK